MLRFLDRAAVPGWLPILVLVPLLVPIAGVSEFDPDEGVILETSRRMLEGHRLYRDIWSDQPPLHAWALAGALRVAGALRPGEPWALLLAGRLISLACAALMGAGLYRVLRREVSVPAAAAGAWMLATAYMVVRMSGAAMMGLPAVALAFAGCWWAVNSAAAQTRGRAAGWAVAAGAALACAMLTKPLAWFAPALAGAFVLLASERERRWMPAAALAAGFAATFLAIGTATDAWEGPSQVRAATLSESTRQAYADQNVPSLLRDYARRNVAVLVLAAIGAWLVLRAARPGFPDAGGASGGAPASPPHTPSTTGNLERPSPLRISPAWLGMVWLLASAGSIALHRPIWWHHLLLLSLPLAWLAGYGAQWLLDRPAAVRQEAPTRTAIASRWLRLAALLLLLALAFLDHRGRIRPATELRIYMPEEEAVALLRAAPPGPVFTDRLIYATAAGREVPPWWTVFSQKRLRGDPAMFQRFPQSLEDAGVTAVLVARWRHEELGPEFIRWLDSRFLRVDREGGVPVYYRRDRSGP